MKRYERILPTHSKKRQAGRNKARPWSRSRIPCVPERDTKFHHCHYSDVLRATRHESFPISMFHRGHITISSLSRMLWMLRHNRRSRRLGDAPPRRGGLCDHQDPSSRRTAHWYHRPTEQPARIPRNGSSTVRFHPSSRFHRRPTKAVAAYRAPSPSRFPETASQPFISTRTRWGGRAVKHIQREKLVRPGIWRVQRGQFRVYTLWRSGYARSGSFHGRYHCPSPPPLPLVGYAPFTFRRCARAFRGSSGSPSASNLSELVPIERAPSLSSRGTGFASTSFVGDRSRRRRASELMYCGEGTIFDRRSMR